MRIIIEIDESKGTATSVTETHTTTPETIPLSQQDVGEFEDAGEAAALSELDMETEAGMSDYGEEIEMGDVEAGDAPAE